MNDKRISIILTIICAVLMAIATVYATVTAAESVPEGVPPEVNAEGLCVYTVKEPEYEMYFTDADVVAIAKMLYGESRGCSIDNQQKAVWCVLNRVDADGFPDTIIGVLSQPDQFSRLLGGVSCMGRADRRCRRCAYTLVAGKTVYSRQQRAAEKLSILHRHGR